MSEPESGTRKMRLKHVAAIRISNVDKKSVDSEQAVRLCNYTDVYYNAAITADLPFMEATATDKQIDQFALHPGDVVVTKDSEVADDIAVPAFVGETLANVICGYHLALIRPQGHLVDGKFLYWTLASTPLRARFGSEATGVTRFGLRADSIANTVIRVPDQRTQRRLAAFLDSETARIDALIEKKRRMIALVHEQAEGRVEHELRAAVGRYGETPLKHMAREVTVGIVVTPARWYAEEGVPALRGVNVVPGRVRLDDLVFLTPEGHALHPKSRLLPGDLVTVRSGQAGATAVVPSDLHGANCIDLLITRPGTGISPDYLEAVMNSDWCRKHVAAHSVGAIQSHFNVEALKYVPVPSLPVAEQEAIAERLRAIRKRAEHLVAAIEQQIDLLLEHRQALITAAVTGELRVPLAA